MIAPGSTVSYFLVTLRSVATNSPTMEQNLGMGAASIIMLVQYKNNF